MRGRSYVPPEAAYRLGSQVESLARAVALNTLARLADAQQVYTGAELRARWHLSEAELGALLRTHDLLSADHGPGKRIAVHIDDVLRLDEVIRREYGARREAAAAARERGERAARAGEIAGLHATTVRQEPAHV